MKRQPAVTFIKVLGLASAMAASIILTLFVIHERSFEEMHKNAPQVYRTRLVRAYNYGSIMEKS